MDFGPDAVFLGTKEWNSSDPKFHYHITIGKYNALAKWQQKQLHADWPTMAAKFAGDKFYKLYGYFKTNPVSIAFYLDNDTLKNLGPEFCKFHGWADDCNAHVSL